MRWRKCLESERSRYSYFGSCLWKEGSCETNISYTRWGYYRRISNLFSISCKYGSWYLSTFTNTNNFWRFNDHDYT